MRFRNFGFAILAAMLLPFTAAPALAQGKIEAPDGDWIHSATGTVLPQTAAGFRRMQVYEFDADGRNVGSNYHMRTGESAVTVTVYLYPSEAGKSCEDEFRDVVARISKYKGAKVTKVGPISVPWIGPISSGYHARLALPEGAVREGTSAALSDGFLYCPANTGWRVKYRATWFGAEETFPDVGPLLRSIKWAPQLK